MKANKIQIKICNTLSNTINFWKDSNDIESPTHLSDLEDCHRVYLEDLVSEDDLRLINSKMEDLYWIIRRYKN
jgi:hypothetical protein